MIQSCKHLTAISLRVGLTHFDVVSLSKSCTENMTTCTVWPSWAGANETQKVGYYST